MNPKRLNQEVRWLGDLLGEVIRKMEGEAGFVLEERIRNLSKARRNGDAQAAAALSTTIKGLTLDESWLVCRAFSIFFDLSNLAEDRHRVRTLRERELHNQVRPESLAAAIEEVRNQGLSAERVQEILNGILLEPVFTAHPTEAKRRAVRNSLRRIRRALNEWEAAGELVTPGEQHLPRPAEQRRVRRRLMEELQVLWLTDPLLSRPPTVLEEVDRGMYFMRSLWKVIPRLHRDLKDALEDAFPGHTFTIPSFVRFGTWMGGDRDGNPFVTSQVSNETLRKLRRRALKMHARQSLILVSQLTHSEHRVLASGDLKQKMEQALWQWPTLQSILEPLSLQEVYRRWLAIIHWRLTQSLSQLKAGGIWPGAYQKSSELKFDLLLLKESLHPQTHTSLEEWLVQLDTFGFHLATLDVRQEASVYNQVLANDRDEMAKETLSLFRLLNFTVARHGPEGLGCHILSMTHSSQDILNLLHLQTTHAPLVKMPLVPLFETIRDLQRGPEILEELFQNRDYAGYLKEQNNQQVVMIGYSDSTKDGGYLAANWALYQGQERMLTAAAKYGIKLLFFHGRGGALGRGGGPAARSILSLPPHSTDTGMRITEQGEVLSARYDDPLVAQRHLEQLTWALFQTQAELAHAPNDVVRGDLSHWLGLMQKLSDSSYEAYRALVESPGFMEFFRQGTPIEGIEYLQIGSRPHRKAAVLAVGQRPTPGDLSNLRAIPWVFSWTQNRVLLPAFYGLGTALEEVGATAELQAMYKEWPFFTAVMDNAILALAKADFGIVEEYAGAVESLEARKLVWDLLSAEYQRTLKSVLSIVGQQELLDNVPWLKRSIQVRNPYVDPLNLVQVETLRRLRSQLPESEALHYRNLLRMTIQGIAGGLRTTG